mmetsp:Transcript_106600/g.306668  ORF Transcript_106600/g.306668 Transcript_106600/m.306668 type:complete len:312 (+) Transcript_106600:499-1434(+)
MGARRPQVGGRMGQAPRGAGGAHFREHREVGGDVRPAQHDRPAADGDRAAGAVARSLGQVHRAAPGAAPRADRGNAGAEDCGRARGRAAAVGAAARQDRPDRRVNLRCLTYPPGGAARRHSARRRGASVSHELLDRGSVGAGQNDRRRRGQLRRHLATARLRPPPRGRAPRGCPLRRGHPVRHQPLDRGRLGAGACARACRCEHRRGGAAARVRPPPRGVLGERRRRAGAPDGPCCVAQRPRPAARAPRRGPRGPHALGRRGRPLAQREGARRAGGGARRGGDEGGLAKGRPVGGRGGRLGGQGAGGRAQG